MARKKGNIISRGWGKVKKASSSLVNWQSRKSNAVGKRVGTSLSKRAYGAGRWLKGGANQRRLGKYLTRGGAGLAVAGAAAAGVHFQGKLKKKYKVRK